MTAPAGWYPDPWRQGPWRWWDGAVWTGHVGAGTPPLEDESGPAAWARWAPVVWALTAAGGAVASPWTGHSLRVSIDRLRQQINDGSASGTSIQVHVPAALTVVNLVNLVLLGVGIVFLVWQHRAAGNARRLGYPARLSPGLGVGGWFIPVVNLWYPFWALRDCLPPDHPRRRGAGWVWAAYLGAGFGGAACVVAGVFSVAAAVVLAVAVTAVAGWAAWRGQILVDAIVEDHRRASSLR